MANTTIEVTVTSDVFTSASPTRCTVVITNCDTRHFDARRPEVNGSAARFPRVPPGRYYIVMVPEGDNPSQMQFIKIDGTSNKIPITFDLSTLPTTGRITVTVLVGGQGVGGKTVTITGTTIEYKQTCMTDDTGVADFHDVPEEHKYVITAHHNSESQVDSCDLTIGESCEKKFRFLGV